MNRNLRRCLRTLVGLIVVVAGLLVWQAFVHWQLVRMERQLVAARTATSTPELPTPATRLARAQVLVNGANANAAEAALDLYRQVEAEGSEPLRRIARYDTANLYMRQAQGEAKAANGEAGRSVPLIELAKGIYRGLLKETPADWDLRYNLEQAIRMLPEDDPEAEELNQAAPENMENAPTTMRGTSMGMP